MATIKWTGSKGNEIELQAEYKSSMLEQVLNADGYEIKTGKMIKIVDASLVLYIDGKKVDSCYNVNMWEIIDIDGTPYKRIWGITKVGMTAEQAELVEKFLSDVIAKGEAEEVKDSEKAEKENAEAKKIANAKETIAKAEAQNNIPTAAEYKAWARNYNNINNDGGWGYVPTMITKEQYDAAKKALADQ